MSMPAAMPVAAATSPTWGQIRAPANAHAQRWGGVSTPVKSMSIRWSRGPFGRTKTREASVERYATAISVQAGSVAGRK